MALDKAALWDNIFLVNFKESDVGDDLDVKNFDSLNRIFLVPYSEWVVHVIYLCRDCQNGQDLLSYLKSKADRSGELLILLNTTDSPCRTDLSVLFVTQVHRFRENFGRTDDFL